MIRKTSGRTYLGRALGRWVVLPLCLIGAASCVLLTGGAGQPRWSVISLGRELRPTGNPQLNSVKPLVPTGGNVDREMCQWVPASASAMTASLFEAMPL